MKPIRIQRSRQHKQVSPNGLPIRYVGRGSKWGNPFRIVQYSDGKWAVKTSGNAPEARVYTHEWILATTCRASYDTREAAARDAIRCYAKWLLPYEHDTGCIEDFYYTQAALQEIQQDLKGKNLSCWCKPDNACHADWLLKIANN